MLTIHDDFARFMDELCRLDRKPRQEAIWTAVQEQPGGSWERRGGQVVIDLYGITAAGERDELAVRVWYLDAQRRRRVAASGRAA